MYGLDKAPPTCLIAAATAAAAAATICATTYYYSTSPNGGEEREGQSLSGRYASAVVRTTTGALHYQYHLLGRIRSG